MTSSNGADRRLIEYPGTLPAALIDVFLQNPNSYRASKLGARPDLTLDQARQLWEHQIGAEYASIVNETDAAKSYASRLGPGSLEDFLSELVTRWRHDARGMDRDRTCASALEDVMRTLGHAQIAYLLSGDNVLCSSLAVGFIDQLNDDEAMRAIVHTHDGMDRPDNGIRDYRDTVLVRDNLVGAISTLRHNDPGRGAIAVTCLADTYVAHDVAYNLCEVDSPFTTAEVQHLTDVCIVNYDAGYDDSEWVIRVVRAHGHQMSEAQLAALATRGEPDDEFLAALAVAREQRRTISLLDPLRSAAHSSGGLTALLGAAALEPDIRWGAVLEILSTLPEDVATADAIGILHGVLA